MVANQINCMQHGAVLLARYLLNYTFENIMASYMHKNQCNSICDITAFPSALSQFTRHYYLHPHSYNVWPAHEATPTPRPCHLGICDLCSS